jgi:hypothetical protein
MKKQDQEGRAAFNEIEKNRIPKESPTREN